VCVDVLLQSTSKLYLQTTNALELTFPPTTQTQTQTPTMEEGAHVWLRSKSSHWGWVPARITKKTTTTTAATGRETTQLTFEDDGSGHYDELEPFEETLEFDSNALQSMELEDVKMRNMDGERAVTQGSFRLSGSASKSAKNVSSAVVGGVDDLIGLMHLHEPAILHSLRIRYDKDIIYTNTGPILIAINPFKAMPKLYSKEVRICVVTVVVILVWC